MSSANPPKPATYTPKQVAALLGSPPKPATYTSNQAAALLGCHVMTVYRRCADGSIPSFKLGGMVRIPAVFIDDLITNGSTS